MHISHAVVLFDVVRAVQGGEVSGRDHAHRRAAAQGRRQLRRRRRR